ncbi:hypothetical protein [Stutzerimonas stutzeri]|uniref:hypothetical protein n=1 Tax=Stutzerimonas stutzeri TaxID=316 RepID=UPI00210DFA26|nr:hypothetical protein [Stutzerimonas stutzeri]MCQ4260495.1 hypothetical protein [Stutzerimonas stutzeri]
MKRDPPYELLRVFDLLGSGQPRVTTHCRRLYQALYGSPDGLMGIAPLNAILRQRAVS